MKSKPVERTKGFFFNFYQQWTDLFKKDLSWYDFTIIDLDVEYAPYASRWEFNFSVLGFNFSLDYVYSEESELNSRINEGMSELEATVTSKLKDEFGDDVEVLDPFGQLKKFDSRH